MKIMNKYIKLLIVVFTSLLITSCVHDDKYDAPDLSAYQCGDLTATMTLEQLKKMPQNQTFTTDDVVEGYISSSDETGNIYKYIYIQDSPDNPTQGLVVSVDAVSTYANYPQGSKVYIKLKDLAMGQYGSFVQLGAMDATGTFGRIPEKAVATNIIKSCGPKATIVPKVMTLGEMRSANDQYVGVLVQVNDAEFHSNDLCKQYAPEGQTVNRSLTDATFTGTSRVVRNSGYASFANKNLPTGNGTFVGILSKFGSGYQLFVVRDSDLNMDAPRIDRRVATCASDPSATAKTVEQVKQYYTGALTQITENATLTGKVTANDAAGNLYKYFYIEDATGGIRVNVNMLDMYMDRRFQVGRTLTINLKDLYIDDVNGELQLGGLFQGRLGQVETADVYKHFFRTETPITTVTATERTIDQLTDADVGRWIKIKDLQFIESDLGKTYADGTFATNRTLEDCNGNEILLRTSGYADFGTRDEPFPANATEVDTGKGDVYAILSVYRGTYQLWITKLRDIDLDNPRCDGTLPAKTETVFKDGFDNFNNWTAVNVTGDKVWEIQNYGRPAPAAVMNGNRQANEDWLVSKPIALAGYADAYFSFDTDGRYNGNPLEIYVAESYSGDVKTTQWTKVDATLDTDLGAFFPSSASWQNSGNISLKAYAGKNVVIAIKYTSVAGASTTWEVDNVVVKATK